MNAAVPSRPTVLDATVLSNFAYLEQVDALQVLPRPIAVAAVRDEIAAGVEAYTFLANAIDALEETIPVVTLVDETRALAETLGDRLDRGEAESLAVAEIHDGLLVTDDGAARSLARERGVGLTGSIGVMIELVDRNRIDETTADAWLKRLIDETDYRAPSRELSTYR